MAEIERFFAELTAVTDMLNAGDSGLGALHQLVELTQHTLCAVGVSFVEYGSGGGRVIAASGASVWAVGRRVDMTDPLVVGMLDRGRVVEASVDELPAELAGHMRARGIERMLAARAQLTGQLLGSVQAYFPAHAEITADQRAMIAFFGAAAGHLYADNRGLPLFGDGPALSSLVEALAVVGPGGLVHAWNPAAVMVTGLSAEAVLDRPFPLPLPHSGQVLEHRLANGRWLQLLATELPAGGTEPGGTSRVVTLRDVSAVRRQEQARDLFVTVTSHELRTPVTVIKGYADTLADHWDSIDEENRRDAADRLRQRATELARLVERLLSAVGDGSALAGTAGAVPFDLADALRAGTDELPAELRRRLTVRLPDGLPKALGERAAVSTVLSELSTNAAKYSPDGEEIELTGVVDARTVGFRISDRGIGVSPQNVERAFERFWQAETGDQRRYGGVGLGLYLVRQIIERQSGWVSLRPRERGGTVAEVRLPRADIGPGEA